MPEDNAARRDAEIAQVVGRAIQDLTAARLGRGFLPLSFLLLLGVGQMLARSGGFALAVGAPLAAGAMLAYGMRVVQRAFGRARRRWMTLAALAAFVPPVFGVYVVGWEGLRRVAEGGGVASMVSGVLFALLGVWVLRAWIQLLELHRLAATMALGMANTGEGEK